MGLPFPSEEWIRAYKDAINNNQAYKVAGAGWTHGVVALICKAQPPFLEKDMGIWLDLEKGVCREAKMVSAEEAQKAPFCITGEYARWKQVLRKELDPVKGMMQGKLKLKGDLPTVVRFVKASQELVNSGGMVDTEFLDEK
jgi:putative sterol carrier protein